MSRIDDILIKGPALREGHTPRLVRHFEVQDKGLLGDHMPLNVAIDTAAAGLPDIPDIPVPAAMEVTRLVTPVTSEDRAKFKEKLLNNAETSMRTLNLLQQTKRLAQEAVEYFARIEVEDDGCTPTG